MRGHAGEHLSAHLQRRLAPGAGHFNVSQAAADGLDSFEAAGHRAAILRQAPSRVCEGQRERQAGHCWRDNRSSTIVSASASGRRKGMKRLLPRAWSAIVFASIFWRATSASAQSESAGVNQYFTNCASCHESNEPGHQAPPTSVLKKMTPERIIEVMTTGSMRSAAAALSDQDKRLIAEWVAGRKLDSDQAGAAEKMANICAAHPPVRESATAPAWNGWGVDYRNSRFQPGAAAGLSPGQVSRLQL